MSEYGNDYNDDAFEEIDEEKDEDMSEEKTLDKDEEIHKQFEDPFEEYNNFDPQEEVEDPFEEYINFNPQEEVELNKEDIQEKHQKLAELIHDYNNLLEERIQNTFRQYYDETGKYANFGRNLKKDFIEWVENAEKDPEIINRIKDIQNNQEINNFLNDKIQNSGLSQNEIANQLNEIGLYINRRLVGSISLQEVYKNDINAHKERWARGLPNDLKERIMERLKEEVEKYNAGTEHDSLYRIAKEFPEISKITIDRIAKKKISQEIYEKMWPSTRSTVSPETRERIKESLREEAQKESPRSIRNISRDFPEVSNTYIFELAKYTYPDRYKELWPAIQKIPSKIKNEILKTLQNESQKENPRTLRDIHKDFPEVGSDTIKRLAQQAVPKELHDKIWSPLTTEIPKEIALEIIQSLKEEIKKPDHLSLNEIGKKHKVSTEYTRKLAKSTIPKEIYEKTWKPYEPITADTKKEIINDIKNTKLNISEIAQKNGVSPPSVSSVSQNEVFKDNLDAHRERFPSDENLEIGNYSHLNLNSLLTRAINNIHKQKYYTEPNIYSDKRRPDGLILEDNNFIHQRLTNPQTGEYLRDKLELDPKNLDHVKSTQFDFTNDISYENLINKIEKYQSEDTLLVIVGTRWYPYDDIKHLPVDDRIKYPENVRVISHNLGVVLIGLEGRDKDFYNKIIDFNYNHELDSLKALYNYNLSSINTHSTEELKEDLIQKGLIKEDFYEYFNFEVINKKDDNGKQLDLDYFLNG